MASAMFAESGEDQRQQVFLELLSAARQDSTILPAVLAPMQRYREWFAQLIGAGSREGTLRKVDRKLAAQVLVSEVVNIAQQAQFSSRDRQNQEDRANIVFAVKVRLPNAAGRLKSGMTADAELQLP